MIKKWLEKEKIQNLLLFDILMLALIFFSDAILISTMRYIELLNYSGGELENQINEAVNFSQRDNFRALIYQSFLLFLGFLYLFVRKFDFSKFYIKFSIKALFLGVIFLFIS